MDKKKYYLARLSLKLETQIKAYLKGETIYTNNQNSKDSSLVWVKIPKKWVWLADLLSKPSDENNPEKEE